jgi:hypothetical protein
MSWSALGFDFGTHTYFLATQVLLLKVYKIVCKKKKVYFSWVPVILATQEAEIRRIVVQS